MAVSGNSMYVTSDAAIHKVDTRSGTSLRQLPLPDGNLGPGDYPMLVSERFIILAGMERSFFRKLHTKITIIDRNTGQIVWSRAPLPRDLPGTVSIADGRLFFASLDGVVAFGP